MNLKEITILGFFILSSSWLINIDAQVTIGSTIKPRDGVLLELKETDSKDNNSTKGLGLPRVKLLKTDDLAPCIITNDDIVKKSYTGLTLYNTSTVIEYNPVSATILEPGIYVWNGSIWQAAKDEEDKNSVRSIKGDTESNSFMVYTNCGIHIPVKKAYDIWQSNSTLNKDLTTVAGTIEAKLVWQDRKNLVQNATTLTMEGTGADAHINVFPNVDVSSIEGGNALIALTIGGQIYWTWHVWFTDYDPNLYNLSTLEEWASPTKGGYIIAYFDQIYLHMDRNLGATSNYNFHDEGVATFGMLYQWGRKDPLMRAEKQNANAEAIFFDAHNNPISITTATLNASNNLVSSINNPSTQYNTSSGDWYTNITTNTNHTLWGTAIGSKGDFDPCPKGWAVPFQVSPYASGIGSTVYWNWTEGSATTAWGGRASIFGSFFPAAGRRVGVAIEHTTIAGHLWTANVASNRAYHFSYASSSMSHGVASYKSNAQSVRCVKKRSN